MRYNGSAPGPLVKLREGDRVRLEFRNDLDADSSLHLHGLPLAPAVDAPLTHLPPGATSAQEFTVPDGVAGTYWYHPHAHGDVERQLLAGLAGPIVITGTTDESLKACDDRVLVFTRTGQDVSVNGAVRPVLTPTSGRTRLRLLNATAGDHLLLGVLRSGERTPLHLVATDGGFVDLEARLGTLEVWDVVNEHTTDHPFHLHSYSFQVLSRDGAPEPLRAWRDTVNVPPGATVSIAVPFRGEPGRTVYHCHIASHEDLGMMGVLDVVWAPAG
ncbi:multicopper oxidase [Saccharothrix carnea]|uniref:Multicopper oxidase n=1 Tax=Saccharothrix carnea TaxID=1280637 RepID=A0A2P8IBI1_SACCR|nr:multicopper oxidase family protein [Saccharothrix carnea]PSL55821.1 multicopper oxidase [Saccharothrix carnea]